MSERPIGAIFADPAGLGSTLNRRGRTEARPARRAATRTQPPPAQTPAVDLRDDEPTKASSGGEARRSATATKPKTPAPKRLPDTIVYVTPAQAEAVRAERRATGRTITQIVLSAVESAAPQLETVFQTPTTVPTGRLFQGSARPKVEDTTLGKVQLCLRLIKSDREALDQLAESVHAPSRSHLVRKALQISAESR